MDYFNKSLDIQKKLLGDHPDTARSHNNIGKFYYEQGNYKKALEEFKKALVIYKKAYGEEHPAVADTCYNIGKVYFKQGQEKEELGNKDEAIELFNNAIKSFDEALQKHQDRHIRLYRKAINRCKVITERHVVKCAEEEVQ